MLNSKFCLLYRNNESITYDIALSIITRDTLFREGAFLNNKLKITIKVNQNPAISLKL